MPIDYSQFALSKPKKRPRQKPSHAIYREDGTIERIVLSKTDFAKLTQWVWDTRMQMDGFVRCHIGAHFVWDRCQFVLDHPSGRGHGGGHRDDRECREACHTCNGRKGSVRM